MMVGKPDEMGERGGDTNNIGTSSVSINDKGNRNKRKLDNPSLPFHNTVNPPSTPVEFPHHELSSENFQNPQDKLGPIMVGSSQPKPVAPESPASEWDDPLTCLLKDLLISNIRTIFEDAIKQIVEDGYSEDVARKAISGHGFYLAGPDHVSNIVNYTLAVLKTGKDANGSKDIVFDNFQRLVEFTMLVMVHVLMEVKQSLTTVEAIWLLLICDANVSQACTMDVGKILSKFSLEEVSKKISSSITFPHRGFEAESSTPNHLNPNEFNIPKSSYRDVQSYPPETLKFGSFPNLPDPENPLALEGSTLEKESSVSVQGSSEKLSSDLLEHTQATPQTSKTGRKAHKKACAGRQKSHMERYNKLASNSGNIDTVGEVIVEKGVKPPSECAAVSCSASKTKAKAEGRLAHASHRLRTNTSSANISRAKSSKPSTEGTVSTSTAENINPAVSVEQKPSSNSEADAFVFPEICDYYAGIPYDKSLGKYFPQSEKEELILKLAPEVQRLQNELESWTEWANQKIMQAARRLNQDKEELKALRQEKDEAEKFKTGRKTLEENTMKRLSEMESAVNNSTNEIEKANLTVHRLELENSHLKVELEAAKLRASESAASCQETLEREKKAAKDSQLWKRQKGLLDEELKIEKHKVAELQQEVDKAKHLQNQIEARWKQAKMTKETLLVQAASIQEKREQLEAAAKAEEERIIQKAEDDAKKHTEDIRKLEDEISELKLKSEASAIAALRSSAEGDYGMKDSKGLALKGSQDTRIINVGTFIDIFGTEDLRRGRECVMCLSEMISVLFLPCAHQVLCTGCNELHEKRGMKDCPSCRTPIQQRIHVRFAHPRAPSNFTAGI